MLTPQLYAETTWESGAHRSRVGCDQRGTCVCFGWPVSCETNRLDEQSGRASVKT